MNCTYSLPFHRINERNLQQQSKVNKQLEIFRQTDWSSLIHLRALLILIAMLTWQQLYIPITWHSRNKADKTVREECELNWGSASYLLSLYMVSAADLCKALSCNNSAWVDVLLFRERRDINAPPTCWLTVTKTNMVKGKWTALIWYFNSLRTTRSAFTHKSGMHTYIHMLMAEATIQGATL